MLTLFHSEQPKLHSKSFFFFFFFFLSCYTIGAPDKRIIQIELFKDNFSYFLMKIYVVTPYKNRLNEML